MQKKAREEIQHKEFWGPQDPPPPFEILYVGLVGSILKGKEAPNIKNSQGQGSLGGEVWKGGFLPKFFVFMPFFFFGCASGKWGKNFAAETSNKEVRNSHSLLQVF